MSAERFTPEYIRSRQWSFATLRKLARECQDLEEGEAILAVFWRKVERDPQRHAFQAFAMLVDCAHILEMRRASQATVRA